MPPNPTLAPARPAASTAHAARWLVGMTLLVGVTTVSILPLFAPFESPSLLHPGGDGYAARILETEDEGHTVKTIETTSLLLTDVSQQPVVLLISRLGRDLDEREIGMILRHVQGGGSILITTSNPKANHLTSRFGIEIDGRAILSTGALGLGSVDNASFAAKHITALRATEGPGQHRITSLVQTKGETYLDLDDSRTIDQLDRPGPFIVAVRVAYGAGTATVVGTDEMWHDEAPDLAFSGWLLDTILTEPGTVLVHEGTRIHPGEPMFQAIAALAYATRSPGWETATAAMALVAAVCPFLYSGPPGLEHRYGGRDRVGGDISRKSTALAIKALLAERARERSGLTLAEFERLPAARRQAMIKETAGTTDDPRYAQKENRA